MKDQSIMRPWLLAASLSIALSVTGAAFAQAGVSEAVSITGTVVSVDQKTRFVTLRGPEGNEVTVEAGKDVRNLAQVKPGDTVNVDYKRSLVLELQPAGDVGAATQESMQRAPMGAKPGGTASQSTIVTARIIAIDNAKHTVTLQGPQGNQRTLDVQDPQWQAKLATLKPGQLVRATYTEAVAVSLTAAKPGAKGK